jgi:hypothetical protein
LVSRDTILLFEQKNLSYGRKFRMKLIWLPDDLQNWMSTVLNVVHEADQAIVVYRAPDWECLIVGLPTCQPLKTISLKPSLDSDELECHHIRSVGGSVFLLKYS